MTIANVGNMGDRFIYFKQVTKIGRDAVLYVESLIESIMGGLEGLINILDSEGGFGALENQVSIKITLTSQSHCKKLTVISVSASSRASSILSEFGI